MQDKIKPRTLPGFMELLPNEQILFNKMKNTIQQTYEKYGFLPLDTPIIEDSKVLLAKAGGETEKQIYRFNKGENDLSLRFDLTVPLAKYVAAYGDKLSFPFKRYQIGKVYRGEKAQKGRYREFYQCDIDIIGDGKLSFINDAEIPSIIYDIFKQFNLGDFTICMNNRKILNGLFSSLELIEKSQDILRIIDKIEKIGVDAVKKELAELKIEENKIETIIAFMQIDGTTDEKVEKLKALNIQDELFMQGLYELEQVIYYVRIFGIPENFFKIDLSIARGLDYYTGTVYETFLNKYRNLGSVCSGGRYDNLAEYYTNRKLPGVGISIGLTRLFYQLMANEIISAEDETIADVLVMSMVDDYSLCIEIAARLRNELGLAVQTNIEDQKVKNKFKYADKMKFKKVIIIGEDEIKERKMTIKNMQTGEQTTLSMEEGIKTFKN